jgi:hypothetical protein
MTSVRKDVSVIAQFAGATLSAFVRCLCKISLERVLDHLFQMAHQKRNLLCNFNKQTVKVPVFGILRYKMQKIIDKKNLRLFVFGSSQALKFLDSDTLYKHKFLL